MSFQHSYFPTSPPNQQQAQFRVSPALGLKGRPVTSLEEVKAAAVDFDGSISFFPDLANGKIYTKQCKNKLGVCVADAHQIYLSDKIPNYKFKKVLCHEITHAAMFSYGVYMTLDQEELIADLIATYGEEIIEVTNRIFNKIRGK